MTSLEKIIMLPPSVSKIFYFPLQGQDQLVRTGTIGDGSCLFHSLCHAYSNEYVRMNDDKKMELVSRLRSNMAKKMNINKWKELNGGMVAMVSFQENVDKLFTNFYRVVEKNKSTNRIKSVSLKKVVDSILVDKKSSDLYSSLMQIITLKYVSGGGGVLEKSYRDCNDIDMCKVNVMKNIENVVSEKLASGGLDSDRVSFLTGKFNKLVNCILGEAENGSYRRYIQNLENSESYIDQYQIDLIAEKFNFDIYFINANNRLPYMTGNDKNNYKQRTSVIILWIGENHYEIIGRVIDGTKRVERQFKPDDPLIKMLYTLHCNPTKFASKYPEYIHYLPAELRNSFGVNEIREENSDYGSEDSESLDVTDEDDSDVYSD